MSIFSLKCTLRYIIILLYHCERFENFLILSINFMFICDF